MVEVKVYKRLKLNDMCIFISYYIMSDKFMGNYYPFMQIYINFNL